MTDGWQARWWALLGDEQADPRRFNQGRAFQRSGRVSAVETTPGRLSGSVQGARATPYLVEVLVPTLDEQQWATVIEVISADARFGARLHAGRLPDGLVEALEQRGVALFGRPEDLDARCPCGDAAVPCTHLIALWAATEAAFAEDPFALLWLRGRGRQQLLAELAAARGAVSEAVDSVDPAELSPARWSELQQELPEELELHPAGDPAATLRLLGHPPGWAGNVSPVKLFGPLLGRAARRARELRPA